MSTYRQSNVLDSLRSIQLAPLSAFSSGYVRFQAKLHTPPRAAAAPILHHLLHRGTHPLRCLCREADVRALPY